MPSIEILVYVLTGTMTLVTILGGTLWTLLREEFKSHAEALGKKADRDALHEIEQRFKIELITVKEDSSKIVDKLEARHDRDLEQLGLKLSNDIKTSENNILSQFQIMMKLFNKN